MAASSLLLLIDDIATLLDDVALMTKVAARQGISAADDVATMTQMAAKKTAGVLGDDLALNAQQVTGVKADRELPVVWAVAKGSLRNKAILVPAALGISAVAPWAITPLLMLGGLFLCFEGAEKLLHVFFHKKEETHRAERTRALADEQVDLVAFEKDKIKGAVRTDFILSAEIIVITLGTVAAATFTRQVSPLFRQSAWFRFHNRAEGIRNLYLVGAGTHPGAGLPGVLCSAKVMDALVPSANSAPSHSTGRHSMLALQNADLVMSRKGKSFHWARRWMTSAHAARATRLYGFCRYVDDLADESVEGQDPRTALALVAQGITSGMSQNPIVVDAIALMRECRIEPALILTFIDGITSDLDTVRINDESALIRYCYQAAGTVGSMMCRVLGCHDPAALRHAIDLGIAMQLTNICRDVQADASAGRRYLPASLIGDLDPQALVNPASPLQPRLQACIDLLLDTADRYYRSGEAGLAHLPFGARCSILIAARVYRAIGTQLRQQDNAYWLGRTVVPRRTKSLVTLRALASLPSLPGFWVPARQHDPALHGALSPFLSTDTPTKGQHV